MLSRSSRDRISRSSASGNGTLPFGRAVPRGGRGHAIVPAQLATAGVSSREMDVLLLLAEGLTNRQIAARLFLSPRTVDKHVERLLAKTDSPNRVALAARVAVPLLPLST
jgi:DNA-binding CsgD family transcriptional regulator